MDKDLILESEIGNKIVNPDVAKELCSNGFYILRDSLMKQFLKDELELVHLKEKIKKGDLVWSS